MKTRYSKYSRIEVKLTKTPNAFKHELLSQPDVPREQFALASKLNHQPKHQTRSRSPTASAHTDTRRRHICDPTPPPPGSAGTDDWVDYIPIRTRRAEGATSAQRSCPPRPNLVYGGSKEQYTQLRPLNFLPKRQTWNKNVPADTRKAHTCGPTASVYQSRSTVKTELIPVCCKACRTNNQRTA